MEVPPPFLLGSGLVIQSNPLLTATSALALSSSTNKILIINCLGSCKDSIHVNTLREDRLMKDFEMIFELAKDLCLGRTRGK